MLKAQKVRLYPNREQKQIISSQIGGARYIYNRALALRKYVYTKFGIKKFLHKLSLQYSENQTVVVEDLKIKNMTSKTKGTVYTSQTCNEYGHISKENRKSQEKFVCTTCGHSDNADINASKNILARGIHGNNALLKIAV